MPTLLTLLQSLPVDGGQAEMHVGQHSNFLSISQCSATTQSDLPSTLLRRSLHCSTDLHKCCSNKTRVRG
jgi:hypothetical protein